jgi:hypothetical protein
MQRRRRLRWPDTCQCNHGFIDDAKLGCRPESATPTPTRTPCAASNRKGGKDEFCLCVREHIRCLNGTLTSLTSKCDSYNVIDGKRRCAPSCAPRCFR